MVAWSFLGALLGRWKSGNHEELVCLLQESRNESHTRELKGSQSPAGTVAWGPSTQRQEYSPARETVRHAGGNPLIRSYWPQLERKHEDLVCIIND